MNEVDKKVRASFDEAFEQSLSGNNEEPEEEEFDELWHEIN